jgi:DNA polymerase-4
MERSIAHLSIPYFPVQMEILRCPILCGRSVVIVPNSGARATIQALSPEAKNMGLRKGMLLSAAKKRCGEIEALPFDERYYRSGSEAVLTIVRTMSAIVEPANLGHWFADLSCMGENSSRVMNLCWRTMKDIRAIGVNPTLGLASNKFVSLIAARTSPTNEICCVASGNEKPFLHPLSVKQLPAVNEKIWRQLALMGWHRVGNIAEVAAADLTVLFGKAGSRLSQQANGIDFTPVTPFQAAGGKMFGEILAPDTNDVEVLRRLLFRLVELACAELRLERLQARRMTLALEYADAKKVETSQKLPRPATSDEEMKSIAVKLLEKALGRRVSVRAIMLGIPEMTPAAEQLSLCPAQLEDKRRKIDKAIDAIRSRFGEKAIRYAA